jgi:hypothetical protein
MERSVEVIGRRLQAWQVRLVGAGELAEAVLAGRR